jgi:acyl dehydratase
MEDGRMGSTTSLAALAARTGEEIGASGWTTVDQDMIDRFAALTGDDYFIHTDPERAAAETPFGGAVAHGFLTLSLLAPMAYDALPDIAGRHMQVNYGFDRVRFVAPVPAGARIRARFVLAACEHRPGEATITWRVTVEIAGGERPALVADWLSRVWGDFDVA